MVGEHFFSISVPRMAIAFSNQRDFIFISGLFTLFAPTNEAFDALFPEDLESLKSNPQALQQMLLYLTVNGIIPYDQISNNLQVQSIQGNYLTFHVYDDGRIKTVLGAQIITPNIIVQDGIIHVIDKLLYPIPRQPVLKIVDEKYPTFSEIINKTINRPNLKGNIT